MVIKIDSEIGYWGISLRDVQRQLDDANGDIEIWINSPGGSVFEGIGIFNAIKKYDKGHVTTIIDGLAASMASYIALAGDTIKAYDNATFMIHNAWMFTFGDFNKLRKQAIVLEGLSNITKKMYVSQSGKSNEDVTKLMNDETYFFGNEILDNGFADEIIKTTKDKDSSESKALASESFKSCMQNVESNYKNENTEQIAAVLKECEGNRPNSKFNQKVGTNPSNKEQIENSNQGDSMEYTKESFEALAKEHFKALEDGKLETTKLERERVSGIMALSGNDEMKAKAISDGATIGDTAIALNTANAEQSTKEKQDFEDAAKALEDNNMENNGSQELSEDDKAWAKAESDKYGGKE